MTGGARLAAGVAAVALVVSALGVASPTSADVTDEPTARTGVAVSR